MKRSNIIIIAVVVVAVCSMAVVLFTNKQKINEANKTIDRSQIPVTVTSFKTTFDELVSQTVLPAQLNPVETASVSAEVSGIIDALKIDFGSKVQKGEVVGAIDTKIQQLNLQSTLLMKDKLEDDYKRAKDLYEGKAATEVKLIESKFQYENAEIQADQIKQQIENANIVSPIKGVVTNQNSKAGEFVSAGKAIATIVNISQLKATAFVDETEVYFIENNQEVEVASPSFPDKKLTGKVIYVSPNGDENHNYQVDVLLDNQPEVFKAGTNVNVSINLAQKEHVILIPKRALVSDKKEPYVFVINGGVATRRKIVTGLSQGENIEVVSGLSAGEEVVLSGQINLTDGSKVNVVEQ